MNKIQKYRLGVQFLFLILATTTFFVNFSAIMLVIMGLTLLSGVFFCGWICPFGFIQDLFSKLGRLLGIKKRKMPVGIQKIVVFSRYIALGLLSLIAADFIFNIIAFDPRVSFDTLLSGNVVAIGGITSICFFASLGLFFDRPFCNYFCLEGAKKGVMSILRLFTIKRDESTCVNCKKCDNACPMNIEVSKSNNLRSPHCINCFQCVSSCPKKDALKYGKCNMTKIEKKKYMIMIITITVVIASFFVYNSYTGKNPIDIKDKHHTLSTNEKALAENLPSTSDDVTVITRESAGNLGDAVGIPNGVYTGKGEGFKGPITVQVTVQNQRIVLVEVIKHRDDRKWFNRANNTMPDRIIKAQNTDVNLVSGATYSSMGIRDGVKDALEKAK